MIQKKKIGTADIDYTSQDIDKYASFGIEGTSWLAFRDLPHLIKKHKLGHKALDYGCGAGRSTKFLKSLGFKPIGVDISSQFLKKAIALNNDLDYLLIEKAKIPVLDNYFDFVFSSFVLMMIPSKEEMIILMREIHRILKQYGKCIMITGSEALHCPNHNWLSYETDFVENYRLYSGSKAKLRIKKVDMVFTDYNWLHEDYLAVIRQSGLKLLEVLSPLGKKGDPFSWNIETTCSPYLIYVIGK